MEYVGADVDINNVVCNVMSTHGKLKETFVVPSNPEEMDQLIEKMGNPRGSGRLSSSQIPIPRIST